MFIFYKHFFTTHYSSNRLTLVQIIFAINESSKLTPSETVFRDELNQKPYGFETLKNVHCLIKYNEAMYIHGYVHVDAFLVPR
jgi:hypothetical protein